MQQSITAPKSMDIVAVATVYLLDYVHTYYVVCEKAWSAVTSAVVLMI